ncbi:MAG: hypothetical protein GF330_12275 [Candidatus Eisenbacteria bacterium]|nr:hypothetical protein [Candidatus Eisenbacteria bacterium]
MALAAFEPGALRVSQTSGGQSDAARACEERARWRLTRLAEPVMHLEAYQRALRDLHEMAAECSDDNWDGYGAKAASLLSLARSAELVLSLPEQWLDFEVGVDPDGECSLDWFGPGGAQLAVSIGPSGRLSYAASFGLARVAGVEFFSGSVPGSIALCLERVHRANGLLTRMSNKT